jgi:hypothetical protein
VIRREPEMTSGIRRPELHAQAARLARAACAKYGRELPEDLRQVLSYWQASELGLERAARWLIDYAAALGITDEGGPEEAD